MNAVTALNGRSGAAGRLLALLSLLALLCAPGLPAARANGLSPLPPLVCGQAGHGPQCLPDLQASITTGPTFPRLGQTATITLTSQNTSVLATNVTLNASLDPGLRFQSLAPADWICSSPAPNAAGGNIACSRFSQAANTSLSVVAIVSVPPVAPASLAVSLTVGLAGPDAQPGNNHVLVNLDSFAGSANLNPWDVNAASGGIVDGGQDAFDEWGMVRLAVLANGSLLADTELQGFGLVFSGPGQRWTSTLPKVLGGVRLTRSLNAPPNQNWVRYVDTFYNTTGSPRSLFVSWGGNLGSDANTYPAATSSGDRVLAANDDWAVTQRGVPGTPAGDAVVGYAFRSANDLSYLGPDIFDAAVITTTWPVTGNDLLGHLFTFSLAPGATGRLAYFVYRGLAEGVPGPQDCGYYGGCATPATGSQVTQAASVVAGLAAIPALCDLPAAERASVINWPTLATVCSDTFVPILFR